MTILSKTYDWVDKCPIDFLWSGLVVVVDTVGAAIIHWAVLAGDVGPLAVGGKHEINMHARDATKEEGHSVYHLFIHSLLGNIDQVIG